MQKFTEKCCSGTAERPMLDADFQIFLSQMTHACAEISAHPDSPIALALFHRVEVSGQPPKQAARELDIEFGDAAYLLAGIRDDVATLLVVQLGIN